MLKLHSRSWIALDSSYSSINWFLAHDETRKTVPRRRWTFFFHSRGCSCVTYTLYQDTAGTQNTLQWQSVNIALCEASLHTTTPSKKRAATVWTTICTSVSCFHLASSKPQRVGNPDCMNSEDSLLNTTWWCPIWSHPNWNRRIKGKKWG
jgi:hypothetical protein